MGTNHKKKHSSQFTTPESNSLLLLLDCSSYQVHITQFTGLFPHDTVHETESTKRLAYRRRGLQGTKQRKWSSAAQWLRYRRQAVREAVDGENDGVTSKEVQTRISKVAQRLWGAGHTKEQKFMRDKQHARRCLVLTKHNFGFLPSKLDWVLHGTVEYPFNSSQFNSTQ